jgi:heterodisulfide reductase subunit A-like polyferredoxin
LEVWGQKSIFMQVVQADKCMRCAECRSVCPFDLDLHRAGYQRIACSKCMLCRDACPRQGIKFRIISSS